MSYMSLQTPLRRAEQEQVDQANKDNLSEYECVKETSSQATLVQNYQLHGLKT